MKQEKFVIIKYKDYSCQNYITVVHEQHDKIYCQSNDNII